MQNLADKLGDWNPQLLRELKGRLKTTPVIIAVLISLIYQAVIFFYQFQDYPSSQYHPSSPYCGLNQSYREQEEQLQEDYSRLRDKLLNSSNAPIIETNKLLQTSPELDKLQQQINEINLILLSNSCPERLIDRQRWWRDRYKYIFVCLSITFPFLLLLGGTYLLINDLRKEEERGTLNFLRLTPESESSILTGKILGVPILLYLITGLAIPLHLWSGIGSLTPLISILGFYGILASCCTFFYSSAFLFTLLTRWLGGFQPWLASGVIFWLLITGSALTGWSSSGLLIKTSAIWLRLLLPFDMMGYLLQNIFDPDYVSPLSKLEIFYLPVGSNLVSLLAVSLVNYGLWNYWIWQGIRRCFRNPNATIFSKEQSYYLVACVQIISLAFALQKYPNNDRVTANVLWMLFLNTTLLFSLMGILSPQRQAIQDWARYRHKDGSSTKGLGGQSLLYDLIWAEKSPAVLALFINLAIASLPWLVLMLRAYPSSWGDFGRVRVVISVVILINLMLIYGTIAQTVLMMKSPQRSLWAVSTVSAVVFLPPIILGMLGFAIAENIWLLFTFSLPAIASASIPAIFTALFFQLSCLGLLLNNLKRLVQSAGESETKKLLQQTHF